MPIRQLRRLIDVNVIGTVLGVRAAIPVMRRQGRGVVIDVASVLGGTAPYMGGYALSKAALDPFDEVLREELLLLGEPGIKVCTVLPTGVDTPFFHHAANFSGRALRSLPPMATPERVARAMGAHSPSAAPAGAGRTVRPSDGRGAPYRSGAGAARPWSCRAAKGVLLDPWTNEPLYGPPRRAGGWLPG